MSDKKDQMREPLEPKSTADQEVDMQDDALVYVALRGAVKPDDLAPWEVQELCRAFLRHMHEKRGE